MMCFNFSPVRRLSIRGVWHHEHMGEVYLEMHEVIKLLNCEHWAGKH